MIVECTKCKIRLRIPDDRIKPEGSKFKCSKCGAVLVVKKPAALKKTEVLQKRTVQYTKKQESPLTEKYPLSTFMILSMIATIVVVLLMSLFFMIACTSLPMIISMAAIDIIITAVILWRLVTPVVEISETGLKVNIPFLFKSNSAQWDEIEGVTIGEIITFGFKEKNVRINLKAEGTATKEITFSLKAVDKADRLIERLREKIPEKKYEDLKHVKVLQKPLMKKEIRYKGFMINELGIKRKKEMIPWDKVKEIKYPGLVIAGYGATTITYNSEKGNKNLIIKPSLKEEYLDVIRYIIHHSQRASIDPSLINALGYFPGDAKTDILSVSLLVVGFVLLFIALIFVAYYAPTDNEGITYIFAIMILSSVPVTITIRKVMKKFRGEAEPPSKKLLWASLFNVVIISSVLVLLITSPLSYYWVMGDIFLKLGNLDTTEQYYQKALNVDANNKDVLYDMGKLYRNRKEWEKAFDYLRRAYIRDPAYWGPAAVVLIPDTLMKMGRHDEALEWCKRILKDNPKKARIARAISKKQDEIIREMNQNK
jgi:predicted Zn finger-like uncharacterized protein